MIKNYLFDLDGTLLPLDEDLFIKIYMQEIGKKFHSLGYDPEKMIKEIWKGTAAMVNNDGSFSNEDIFWNTFQSESVKRESLEKELTDFYNTEFSKAFVSTKPSVYAKRIVDYLKKNGKNIYLLTNPIFPLVATKKRIEHAGLSMEDFEIVTTYENSCYAKPNPKYYESILDAFSLNPKETIMVGNDVEEDMIASTLELKTFLVTDCLKNSNNLPYDHFDQGSLEDFYRKLVKND